MGFSGGTSCEFLQHPSYCMQINSVYVLCEISDDLCIFLKDWLLDLSIILINVYFLQDLGHSCILPAFSVINTGNLTIVSC